MINKRLKEVKPYKIVISFTVVMFITLFILGLIMERDNLHIDVEKCLQQDNFTQYSDHIEEKLYSEGKIIEKSRTNYKNNNNFFLKVEYPNGLEANIKVTEEQYVTVKRGDYITIERTVVYNLDGMRLYYTDDIKT